MFPFRVLFLALTVAVFGVPVTGSAQEKAAKAPTRLEELMEVQKQVQSILPNAVEALVVMRHRGGTASGVIVSPDGLLLTAAHVIEEPGTRMNVVLSNGKKAVATALGLDTTTDAGMAQLRGDRKDWPYLPVRRLVGTTRVGEWCFAIGHPGGLDKARGPVVRVGRVLKHSANGLQTDCVLMGGDSGGPLLDLEGRVIGIHSQIWTGREQNMHVSLAPFLRGWEAMKESKVIRTWSTGSGGYLGVVTRAVREDEVGEVVLVDEVLQASPAEIGGLQTGDALIRLGNVVIDGVQHFSQLIRQLPAGELISLRVLRGDRERTVEVKLGRRPEETP